MQIAPLRAGCWAGLTEGLNGAGVADGGTSDEEKTTKARAPPAALEGGRAVLPSPCPAPGAGCPAFCVLRGRGGRRPRQQQGTRGLGGRCECVHTAGEYWMMG